MTRLKLFLLLISCPAVMLLSGNEPSFGDVKVKISFEHAPAYRSRTGSISNGSALFDNERYLAVEAVYTPGVVAENATDRKGKQLNTPQSDSNVWLDGVQMKVLVAYPAVPGRTRKETVFGLFSGETVFRTIRLDGKKHSATMFVPPQLLARYAGSKVRTTRSNEKQKQRSSQRLSLRDFFVEVIFVTSDGKELGRGYSQVDGARTVNEKDAFFRRLEARAGKNVIKKAVLSRDDSPWALINPHRYDLIMPEGADR